MILKDLVQHYIINIRQNTCFGELFNTNGSTSAIFSDAGFDTDTHKDRKQGCTFLIICRGNIYDATAE